MAKWSSFNELNDSSFEIFSNRAINEEVATCVNNQKPVIERCDAKEPQGWVKFCKKIKQKSRINIHKFIYRFLAPKYSFYNDVHLVL